MKMKITDLGVDSGKMAMFLGECSKDKYADKVSDPENSIYRTLKIRAGAYSVFVETNRGDEETSLRIERCESESESDQLDQKLVVDKDSILIVGDPCYYLGGEYGEDGPYDASCKAADNGHWFQTPSGRGYVCRSGRGDGMYPLVVHTDSDGFVIDAYVQFIDEDDYEDDDYEDEDEDLN